MRSHYCTAVCLALVTALGIIPETAAADDIFEPVEISLWDGPAPGSDGVAGDEVWNDRGSSDRSVRNVHKPTLTVYLPPKEINTGTAIVIAPGGGYGGLAIDKEGHDVARWLAVHGVAGFVLKYRLPRPEGHVYGHTVPLMDAQRAVRTVRRLADQWGIATDRIGVMGYSAGGHLMSTLATHYDAGVPDAKDPIERVGCRPDFQVLVYPVISLLPGVGHTGSRRNLFGADATDADVQIFCNDRQVTADTPPAFLVHATDDPVKVDNGVLYYEALHRAGVPAEMHLFAEGGHGFGIRKTNLPVADWPILMTDWLAARGMLGGK